MQRQEEPWSPGDGKSLLGMRGQKVPDLVAFAGRKSLSSVLKGSLSESMEGTGMCLQSSLCCSGGWGVGGWQACLRLRYGRWREGGVIQLPGSEDAGTEPSALCPSSALLFFPCIPQIFIERLL